MNLYNPSEYWHLNKLWAIKHHKTFSSSCETVVAQSFYYIIRVKAVTSHKIQSVAKSNIWLGGLGIPDITVQSTFLRAFTSLSSFANINDRCTAANLIVTWICITVTTMLLKLWTGCLFGWERGCTAWISLQWWGRNWIIWANGCIKQTNIWLNWKINTGQSASKDPAILPPSCICDTARLKENKRIFIIMSQD